MDRLPRKVAVITGAAGEIGRAIAKAFVAEGASVACLDTNFDGALASARAAANGTSQAEAFRCDISDAASVAETNSALKAQFSRFDVLVNNAAAISPDEPVHTLDELG